MIQGTRTHELGHQVADHFGNLCQSRSAYSESSSLLTPPFSDTAVKTERQTERLLSTHDKLQKLRLIVFPFMRSITYDSLKIISLLSVEHSFISSDVLCIESIVSRFKLLTDYALSNYSVTA
jgi:hypothetical protein